VTTPVGELITPEDVALGVDARTADAVLVAAADLIARRHGLSARTVHEDLAERGRAQVLALGHGFALPHARIAGLDRPLAVFLATSAGVDFRAPDRRPVHYFLVLLVPAEATERHLAIMACAARQFGNPGFRSRLRAAGDARAVAEAFGTMPP
jgi:PTS system nitrogen regulatory IIA component